MILIFDTETTGIANFRAPASDPSQPRIVQLGAVLCDEARRVVGEMNLLVKPAGWTIPAEATAIHGITTEACDRYGLAISTVVPLFIALARRAELTVAHSHDFDRLLVSSELHRLDRRIDLDLFQALPGFCTMKRATDLCRLPSPRGVGFKWPSLQEAHRHFFGEEFAGAHDAMADVRACARVFWALREKGLA